MGFGFVEIRIPNLGQDPHFHRKGKLLDCERCHKTSFSQCDEGHFACDMCGTKIEINELERRAEKDVVYHQESVRQFRLLTIVLLVFLGISGAFGSPYGAIATALITVIPAYFWIKNKTDIKKSQEFLDSVKEARRALQSKDDAREIEKRLSQDTQQM